jgi:hypothetical protein
MGVDFITCQGQGPGIFKGGFIILVTVDESLTADEDAKAKQENVKTVYRQSG